MTAEPPPLPGPHDVTLERRLHPMSWLFVMLQQLRTFLVPLVAFFIFGRTDRNELWSLVAVLVVAAVAVWRYLTYSYRIDHDRVLIRSGLLERTLRQIPLSRIHNVALHQTVLHRIFGVAEVRLESAGGNKPEAEMRVLRLTDAQALEALVRRRGAVPITPSTSTSTSTMTGAAPVSVSHSTTDAAPLPTDNADHLLLSLSTAEVLRLGIISNRGMIVVGAAVVAVSQLRLQLPPDMARQWGRLLNGYIGHLGLLDAALLLVGLFAAAILLLRGFSVVLALLQYSGFQLRQHGRRLTAERGLLTRLRTSVPQRRIQAFHLHEGLLHRAFGRRTLSVATAVSGAHHDDRSFRELAPIASPVACDSLVQRLLPQGAWPPTRWLPLHPRTWWRLSLPGALFTALLTTALCWRYGNVGFIGLAWLPLAVLVARQRARRAGYAVDTALVAMRDGWWSRHWRIAELDKLQVLQLRRSPMDRLFGMATLSLDTAGTDPRSSDLRLRFLPVADALALQSRLASDVARRRLRW